MVWMFICSQVLTLYLNITWPTVSDLFNLSREIFSDLTHVCTFKLNSLKRCLISNLTYFFIFFSSLTPDEEPDGEQGDQSLKNNKNNPFLENAENVSVADSSVQIDDVSKLKTAPNSASFPSRQLVYSPESPSTSSCPPLSPQRPHPGMCICFNITKKDPRTLWSLSASKTV